jgi:RNA polymerase sigma factor (sigma-70 family)
MAGDASCDLDDDGIVLRMMEGDQDALRLLIKAHGGKTRAYLKKKFKDVLAEPEIDEAMNVAAFNAFRFADRYDKHEGSLGTWFTTIAVRAAQSIVRKDAKHRHKDLEYDPEYDPAGCDEADESAPPDKAASKRIQGLRDAVHTALTPGERKVILADLAAGEGNADNAWLAEKMGTTKNSISALRSKAHKKIHDYMISKGLYQDTQRGKR